MKVKKFVWLILFLIITSNVYADCHTKEGYQECIKNNQDFQTKSGDFLPAKDIQSYSGTVYLTEGSSAEMPENFAGVIVLTDATVKMPNGRIVKGIGRCDKDGCTILTGETGEGLTKVNGQFRATTNLEIYNGKIGDGSSSIEVANIKNLEFNADGTFSLDVEDNSEVAGAVIGTAGTVIFDPKTNSLKPSILNPDKNSVFVIKSIDPTKKPIIFVKDNVDVQLVEGMFLTKDSIKVVFKDEDCTDNCVLLTSNSIKIKGKGDTVKLNEENRVANVLTKSAAKEAFESKKTAFFNKYGLDMKRYDNFNFEPLFDYPGKQAEKLGLSEDELKRDWKELVILRKYSTAQRSLEISPASTGIVEIQNRNVYSASGYVDIEKSQAPKVTVKGDESELVWAEIKDDGISFQAGKDGVLNYRIPRRGFLESAIPIEINIVNSEGRSLIANINEEDIKFSITNKGDLRLSTVDAQVDSEGYPSCASSNSVSGNVIYKITGKGILISGKCKSSFFQIEKIFTSFAAIETAQEEYHRNLAKSHDFKPEYAQNLENIALYFTGGDAAATQIEIMENLPSYTKIKLFVPNEKSIEYLREALPHDIFSRITFLKAPLGQRFSVWAQDYSKGDSKVQILPLTYLGGETRKTPDNPQNEIIYEYEKAGIEIRGVPVEFAGGNVFIARDSNGKMLLLNGADDFLYTKQTYKEVQKTISEEEFKEVLRNAFNVDEVVIVGRRDEKGALQRQYSNMFHIDQSMLPLADGLVAMPKIELPANYPTKEEIYSEWSQGVMDVGKKFGVDIQIVEGRAKYEMPQDLRLWVRLDSELQQIDARYSDKIGPYLAKEDIEAYRNLINQKGFRIIDVYISPDNVKNFQAYVNGIVYTDRDTGEKTVIMPVFPDKNGEYKMEGLNLKNKEAFESNGYKVKVVRDRAFKYNGNIHCLTILASNTQHPPNTCPLTDITA